MKLPKAKNADMVMQPAGKELLVYNLITHKACHLNETSKIIYQACDGKVSFDDLKKRYMFSEDLIHLTLDELKRNDLLENYQSNYFAGLSRREVIKKVGLASMIALPLVSALTAPIPANAVSPCRGTGQTGSFTTISNTTNRLCTNVGYADSACCILPGEMQGESIGTTFTPDGTVDGNGIARGTCTGITCK